MSPEEVRHNALLRFGNPTATRERVASADALPAVESVWSDVCFACRQWLKPPGFGIPAVLTLAIGIGANTAIFSDMDAVVLRPPAVPDLGRVVTIAEQKATGGFEHVAPANYEHWARQSRSFGRITGIRERQARFSSCCHLDPCAPGPGRQPGPIAP